MEFKSDKLSFFYPGHASDPEKSHILEKCPVWIVNLKFGAIPLSVTNPSPFAPFMIS